MQPDIRPTLQQMVDALALILSGTARSSDGRMGRFDTPSWATLEQADDALAAGRALLSDAAPQEHVPAEWEDLSRQLDKEVAPQGEWVMVPRKMTLRMMAAAGPAVRACLSLDGKAGTVVDLWEALLAAAPAAQPATPDAGYVPLSPEDIKAIVNALPLLPWGHGSRDAAALAQAIEREVLSRVQAVRKPLKTEEVHLTAPGPMEASTTQLPLSIPDVQAAIRAAGGIVHGDGNIFFTRAEQFIVAAVFCGESARGGPLRSAVRPQWPRTPAQIRDFIGSNFISREDEKPAPEGSPAWAGEATENDVYTLSAHDLLSAFEWWADAQEAAAAPKEGA